MPGSALSNLELKLLRRWNSPTGYPKPVLKKLEIAGKRGLRGLKNVTIDFKYPVTVLCGKNGSGKSTILMSALLAFHSHSADLPIHQRILRPNRPHFTFGDFFFQGPGDAQISDVSIYWTYSNQRVQTAVHSPKRWLQYDRRETKGTHYIGVLRVVPALEQRVLRTYFKADLKLTKSNTVKLNDEYLSYYSDILKRSYSSVDRVASASSRYSMSVLNSNAQYSSYNSGVGEDALATILFELQECLSGAFIAIEEVEAGLHPAAQKRLTEMLQVIAEKKSLQIVITSHSAAIIDSLPREARVLLQRAGKQFVATPQVTTRFAMADLAGEKHAELFIFCEDVFAQCLIEAALTMQQRQRTVVLPIGSDASLADQLASHTLSKLPQKVLIVWDGDVRTKLPEAKRWVKKASVRAPGLRSNANWSFLPGKHAPEDWALAVLQSSHASTFANAFDFDVEVSIRTIESMKSAASAKDARETLMQAFDLTPDDINMKLARVLKEVRSSDFDSLRTNVEKCLTDGEVQELFSFNDAIN